jgi:hypothetical protein
LAVPESADFCEFYQATYGRTFAPWPVGIGCGITTCLRPGCGGSLNGNWRVTRRRFAMGDRDLRELFTTWAEPIGQVTPPDISVIRRRVRTPVAAAPSYVTIEGRSRVAVVRRTKTGAKVATVRPPRGTAGFVGVAGAEENRTFVLAAQAPSGVRLYELALRPDGQPKRPLVKIAVPPLPRHFGDCPAELAGLAVSPDDRLVAASFLSYCPNGRAGQSEILTARISSGHVLATFRPGHGYPMWLSWTLAGSLVYSWSGTGVLVIPDATKEGSKARLLLSDSASVGQFSGPDFPMVAPGQADALVALDFELGGHWILPTYPTPGAPTIAW